MTKIIFATANFGKLREAREILGDRFELISSAEAGITEDIPETGTTIKENSIIKASYIHRRTGQNCFADDTGLEVDALDGAPGVHAARFANDIALRDGLPVVEAHDFEKNIDALLRELSRYPDRPRTARFRSVVTLILNGEEHFFEGVLEGKIGFERHGNGGFGYDPVFIPDGFGGKTLSELGEDIKNSISHRGQSLRKMADWLKANQPL